MDCKRIGNWTTTNKQHSLSSRELEATLYALNDLTVKEIAREMHIEAGTVKSRLDNARFKLGMQKSLHGLCAEIIRRGIIAPLTMMICIAMVSGITTEARTTTTPQRPLFSRAVRSQRSEASYAAA